MKYDHDFWSAIDTLVSSGKIVIDRPKGSTHPRFPHIRYDVDYGYIENTTSMDGDGIDVWKGSLSSSGGHIGSHSLRGLFPFRDGAKAPYTERGIAAAVSKAAGTG